MNALEKFKNHAYNGTKLECDLKTLALAYLQLHHDNVGLHPDDHVDPDGGYCGWHVLLVDQVKCRLDNRPDEFDYPGWISHFLAPFELFHADDDDELFRNMLARLKSWFGDMDTGNLESVSRDLDSLVMFHDGSPEEVYEPLTDACSVIHWITSL